MNRRDLKALEIGVEGFKECCSLTVYEQHGGELFDMERMERMFRFRDLHWLLCR
jgi:hypothetical protein